MNSITVLVLMMLGAASISLVMADLQVCEKLVQDVLVKRQRSDQLQRNDEKFDLLAGEMLEADHIVDSNLMLCIEFYQNRSSEDRKNYWELERMRDLEFKLGMAQAKSRYRTAHRDVTRLLNEPI